MAPTPLEYLSILCQNALFSQVDEALVSRILASSEAALEIYESGQAILEPGDTARRLGVVVSGAAQVYKNAASFRVLLSVLREGSLVGASNLFRGEEAQALTEIRTKGGCRVLFFSETALMTLMHESFTFTQNYLRYLSERIEFLTGRIESIACPTAADKLLNYLSQHAEGGVVTLPYGMNALAGALAISRATLYRALDELEEKGEIARMGKTITLLAR